MKKLNFLLFTVTVCFISCVYPGGRSTGQIDTTTIELSETVGTDTLTNVNGRSGDNGTGTDTINTVEEK